ncbi:MAG: hypothetical protein K8I30_05870 [Anaerolineae bacterium]|nr:hypothetical protein [Anaerolineae bacterium]
MLPKYKGCASGCLSEVARLAALGIGSLSALIILFNSGESLRDLFAWQGISSLLRYAAVLVTLILGACALALTAHGWQTLAGRRNAVEDQADLTAFNPNVFLNTGSSLSSSSSDDSLAGCLFAIVMAIVGGLFWLGLQLAAGIAGALLPKTSRAGRFILSIVYGLILFGLIIAGLSAIFGLSPLGGG